MKFTVVIPYRHTDRHRDDAFLFVQAHYLRQGLEGITGDVMTAEWSKGGAVDAIVRMLDITEGLVLADADCIVTPEALADSMRAVADGAAWSMPHRNVLRLGRAETYMLYRGRREISCLRASSRPGPPGGGIVVLTREAYATVGGIDPRFYGWGGEDISFARALDTLVGPCVRFEADLWHLYHPRTPRRVGNRASLASEELAGRYLDAEADPAAMRQVIAR